MARQPRLDVDALHRGLRRVLRHGARASRLIRYTSEVVDILYPAAEHPGMNPHDRAISTEMLIRRALESIGGYASEALSIVLGLSAGTLGRSLSDRRQVAGKLLGMEADTFRRDQHEGALLYDVAIEIYRIRHIPDSKFPRSKLADLADATSGQRTAGGKAAPFPASQPRYPRRRRRGDA